MYGAYGEYYSNHPLAKSIVKKYGKAIDEVLFLILKKLLVKV